MISIWLDDIRKPPTYTDTDSWTWFETAESVKQYIEENGIEGIDEISFDNDLGINKMEGYQLATWIEEYIELNQPKYIPVMWPHSANPVARVRMDTIFTGIIKRRESNA